VTDRACGLRNTVAERICGEETDALLDGQPKMVTCVRERGHKGMHFGFFPDTAWTTPW